MNTTRSNPRTRHSNGGWIRSLLLCLVILGCGAGAIYYIYITEPRAERETATKTSAMLVRTITPEAGTFRPRIEAMGTVEPARDIILRPRVRGEVIEHSEHFTPGGYVKKGETLVRLDPSDYEHALSQRRNDLQEARSDLQIERGRQDVAEREYELIDEQLEKESTNKDLVLRKPQLAAAQAAVESARTAVEQAELDLKRTKINAPFDAHVITRDVNIGSQVAAGDRLARLVGLDRYWIDVRIPLSKLRWISLPDDASDAPHPEVRIRDRNAWPPNSYRTGRLYRRVGIVGNESRMARVLVEVTDPLAREDETGDKPPLLIDAPVKTWIQGTKITGAVKLDREYMRKDDTVWVMSDGKLDIREVNVITTDAEYAYIGEGLDENDQVVTTDLTAISSGAPLQKRSDAPADDATNSKPESGE